MVNIKLLLAKAGLDETERFQPLIIAKQIVKIIIANHGPYNFPKLTQFRNYQNRLNSSKSTSK